MTPGKKHGTFQVSTAFHEAVTAYQHAQGLRSWSAAFIQLATIGYQAETGSTPPPAANAWGGDRRSEAAKQRPDTETLVRRGIASQFHEG